jgi:hypothetical protein
VLDKGVGRYRGFALLAISMTGKSSAARPPIMPKQPHLGWDRY